MTDTQNPPVPVFEDALQELQSIIHELEEGSIGLEASLTRFEEGVRLLRNCYGILEQAEQRIEILTGMDAEGNPVTAPFDASATMESNLAPSGKPGRRKAAPRSEQKASSTSTAEATTDEQRLF
ncbi:MAG: exodeoxyribonuclease VII small subunit [Planctomycetales bacterium]